jgi:translation initiation factor 2B subunit (eIF-2B alpha/beta/delta family)
VFLLFSNISSLYQLDSIVSNELGDPFELVRSAQGDETIPETASKYLGPLASSPECPSNTPYQVVNLRYDLTPIQNIAVVATDQGLIPPTSIPVLVHDLEQSGAEKQLVEGWS